MSAARTSSMLAALVATGLQAAPALAQMTHVPENDWRQPDRHDAIERAARPPQFTLEVRFGPYLPNIDGYVPGGATPFTDVFGLDCSGSPATFTGSVKPAFSGGLEFDYIPLRIPYVGAVGPGVGWSFTQFSNQAQLTSSTRSAPQCSQEKTTLQIMPMHLSVILRADELMRRTGVPIVPYGKFGVGLAWWRSSNDLGTEKVCGTAAAPAQCGADKTVPGDNTVIGHGSGLTPSLHFAVGAALALNFLQPTASARLEQTTGVNHAFLFGEYYNDTVTLSQNVMHVGAQSWVAGLAIDF